MDWTTCRRSSKQRRPILNEGWEAFSRNSAKDAGLCASRTKAEPNKPVWFSKFKCSRSASSCSCSFSQFIALANKDHNQSGRTKLDRERLKLCLSEVVSLLSCRLLNMMRLRCFTKRSLFLGGHWSTSKDYEDTSEEEHSEGKAQAGSELPHKALLPSRRGGDHRQTSQLIIHS